MRIKKLELIGFKSFKDRTVIHFDKGITGIVGPNGCGKSNIVDALTWVMGEMSAKHLRGSSMSDVIFAGAEGYAPMGMAEVSLVLENDGGPFPAKYIKHSELMVTRKLHRSGESEYFINKEPARLRDIQEIFMDTGAGSKGFSIIAQGAIGKIITAKPDDRRNLIEEAAGITKFKVRKRESQRKLGQTEQNLVRLQDIIGEQKRQLGSLERQAQRAERYRRLKDEIEGKEIWLSSQKYLNIHVDTEEARKTFEESRDSEALATGDLDKKQTELEALKASRTEREAALQDKQLKNQEAQKAVVDKENFIRELKFEIEQARRNKEMTGGIVEKYAVRKEALVSEQEQMETKVNEVRELADELTLDYETKNQEFEAIHKRVEEIDIELTEKRRGMLTASQSESHLDASLDSLVGQIEGAGERVEQEQAVLYELEQKKAEFDKRKTQVYNDLEKERQMQLDMTKDVESLESNYKTVEENYLTKKEEMENLKDDLNKVSSRLYGLEELHANFEGFQEGVKNVMLWQRQRMEMHADGSQSAVSEFQPVAEVVEVPENYELAMEAALGSRLQLLLSNNSDQALGAVDYLKSNNSGRSGFIASDLNSQGSQSDYSQLKAESGVQELLSNIVRVPDNYRKQILHFLDGVVIVDDIRTALRLRPNYSQCTFVTMEGDTLTPEGVLTGGTSESAQSGVLKRRREIKELSQKREEAAGKLALTQTVLKKLEAQMEDLKIQVKEAQQKHNEKEIQITELKKDYERAENEAVNAAKASESQKREYERESEKLALLNQKKMEVDQSLQEIRLKKQELEQSVESLTEELKTSREGIDEAQEKVAQLRVDSASKKQELEGLNHQLEMINKSLVEVNAQLEQMNEETEKSQESLSENQVLIEKEQVELERLIHEAKNLEENLSQEKDSYEVSAEKVRVLDEEVSSMLKSMNEFQSRMNESQLKLEQLKMKEQYLIDQINERYMKDLTVIAYEYKDQEGDIEVTEKEVEDIKSKLKRIGEVNLSAIEEYDELVERNQFLTQQHQDLIEAKEQLRKVIDRINRICSRRFKETFDQVNERFTKVFPVLFGGGEARLVLIEDAEKGEMGVDIIARPPGKKAANISLLSGGEKALTAVSLIFSIFLVKPSPFCLLDEVDAPLDDANVYRFNDLVKEMAKRSQIIVVTHNKHTMKVNNKLFGVTQEDKGVSKMVSVSLDEAVKVAEI